MSILYTVSLALSTKITHTRCPVSPFVGMTSGYHLYNVFLSLNKVLILLKYIHTHNFIWILNVTITLWFRFYLHFIEEEI